LDAPKPHCLILTGPTGVGKSALALLLAEELNGEIVSADSRQVYRGFDIGTAKPTPAELARIPHHQIDTRDPAEDYSAGEWARDTIPIVQAIQDRGRLPLIVGGSGFYLEALIHPFYTMSPQPGEQREALLRQYTDLTNEQLHEELERVDPDSAAAIAVNDRRKLLRYLEISSLEGAPPSEVFQRPALPAAVTYTLFVIHTERELLYRRINSRVEEMIARGLVDEVRNLLASGSRPEDNAMLSVGYREIVSHLQGESTLAEAVAAIQKNTRNYAKRQLTWFKRWSDARWLDCPAETTMAELAAHLRRQF